jgi:hypothetical protein
MLFPLAGVTIGIVRHEMVILPGALLSTVLYGIMGYFAIRGREWARWLVFAFLLMTAFVGLGFTFVSFGSGKAVVGFNPWIGLIVLFYAGAATATALAANRPAS